MTMHYHAITHYDRQNEAGAAIPPGAEVTLRPAYDSATRARTYHDGITGRRGRIVSVDQQLGRAPMALVDLGDLEMHVAAGRLMPT